MSRRLRFINNVNAFGALITGFKHFHLLDEWRVKSTRSRQQVQK